MKVLISFVFSLSLTKGNDRFPKSENDPSLGITGLSTPNQNENAII